MFDFGARALPGVGFCSSGPSLWIRSFESSGYDDWGYPAGTSWDGGHGSIGYIIWLVGQGHPSETYEFVNWDDDYSQYFWENKIHVPNHQSVNGAIFDTFYF